VPGVKKGSEKGEKRVGKGVRDSYQKQRKIDTLGELSMGDVFVKRKKRKAARTSITRDCRGPS